MWSTSQLLTRSHDVGWMFRRLWMHKSLVIVAKEHRRLHFPLHHGLNAWSFGIYVMLIHFPQHIGAPYLLERYIRSWPQNWCEAGSVHFLLPHFEPPPAAVCRSWASPLPFLPGGRQVDNDFKTYIFGIVAISENLALKKMMGIFFLDWKGLQDPFVVTFSPFARWICFQMAMSWWPSWCCSLGACSPGGYVPGRTSSHGSWNVKGLPFQQNDKWKHLLCTESSKLIMVNLKDLVAKP